MLKAEILESASHHSQNTKDTAISLEEHYLLLNHLLKTKEYDTSETNCTMQLQYKEDEKAWEIKRTYSLENDLVGGLMACLSDPDILSPEATLTVYLNTLKKMNLNEMSAYLGVASIMNTDDTAKNAIAAALVEQIHKNFNFTIKACEMDGYHAVVKTEITTFDSDAILAGYEAKLATYLDSPEAVIDGSQKRYEKSLDILLAGIEANEATVTAEVGFSLVNDGVSWKLENAGSALGEAIFGTLANSPVEEESSDGEYSEE